MAFVAEKALWIKPNQTKPLVRFSLKKNFN